MYTLLVFGLIFEYILSASVCDFKLFKIYQQNALIDGYTYVTKDEIESLSPQIVNQYNNDGGFKILTPFNPGSCCLEFSQDYQNYDGYSFNGSPFVFVYSTVDSEVGNAGGSPCSWGAPYSNPNRLFKFALGPHPATKAATLVSNGVFNPSTAYSGGCTGTQVAIAIVKKCEEQTPSPTDDPTSSPTITPTAIPSAAPTEPVMFVDNVCELLDIDFFLNTCSLHHNGLKTKLTANDVADTALTTRVTTLETQVSSDKSELENKISGLQLQVTNLKNTVQTSFQALASSLGNLGSSAKSVPIFNVDGEVVGKEELIFTTLQSQYLIILSLLFNTLLILGIILCCCIISSNNNQPKRRSYKTINRFESSDSEAMSH